MLKAEPSYPRRLSQLIGIKESHISVKLKKLERAGFVGSKWVKIITREGYKNVKQYYFKSDKLVITFSPEGVEVKAIGAEYEKLDITIPSYKSEIPKITSFVGRNTELDFLKNTAGVKVLWGIAGIGKTTLAAKFISELEHVPVFWHEIKQVDSLSYLITKLAIFFSLQGRKTLLNLVNRGVRDRRALMDTAIGEMRISNAIFVLDDFHRCMDGGISELLQGMARHGVNSIVISRQRVPLQGSKDLKVEGLSNEESAELMKTQGKEPSQDVIARAQGHPLLISLAMQTSSKTNSYVRDAILENLDEAELSMLVPISVFRGRISLQAVQAVTNQAKIGAVIKFIMSMERLGVIAESENEFELHPLVRDAVYGILQYPGELHVLAGNFYYKRGNSGDKLEALFHFIMGKDYEMAIEVLSQYASFIDEGYGEVLVNVIGHLPAINSSRLAAWLLLAEGSARRLLSMGMDASRELLGEAVKSADESGDKRAKALALNGLGIIYKELGEVEMARKYYLEAKKIKGLHSLVVSRTLYNIAEAELEIGNLKSAMHGMEKSMNIDIKYHDLRGYYVSRLNIDYIRFLLGQFETAINDLTDVAEKLEKLGLKSLLGYCYLHMAYTIIGMDGSLSEALNFLNLALDQYALSGFRYMQVYTLAEAIIIKAKIKNIKDAEADVKKLEGMVDGIEDKDVLGNVELARAVLLMASGKLLEAEIHLNNSSKLFSRDWVSGMRVKAWGGLLESLKGDKDASKQILVGVQNQLAEKGCNAMADRFKKCTYELTGSWEGMCKFLM